MFQFTKLNILKPLFKREEREASFFGGRLGQRGKPVCARGAPQGLQLSLVMLKSPACRFGSPVAAMWTDSFSGACATEMALGESMLRCGGGWGAGATKAARRRGTLARSAASLERRRALVASLWLLVLLTVMPFGEAGVFSEGPYVMTWGPTGASCSASSPTFKFSTKGLTGPKLGDHIVRLDLPNWWAAKDVDAGSGNSRATLKTKSAASTHRQNCQAVTALANDVACNAAGGGGGKNCVYKAAAGSTAASCRGPLAKSASPTFRWTD